MILQPPLCTQLEKHLNKCTEYEGQGRNGYLGSAHFFFSPVKIVFLLCGELSVVSIQFW